MAEELKEPKLSDAEKKALYGKRPPRVTIQEGVGYLDELVKTGGATGTADDISRAVSTNAPVGGTYTTRSVSLKNFGLINIEGNTYTLTPLGDQVTSGIPELRKEAVKKAFLQIPTIRKIWDTYKSGLLPARESFGNSLTTRLPDDIPNIADNHTNWANYFLDGAHWCGLTEDRPNGLYLMSKEPNPDIIASGGEISTEKKTESIVKKDQREQPLHVVFAHPTDAVSYSKTLSSGKLLTITIPEDPTPEEADEIIARAKFVIKAMKGFLASDDNNQ